MIRTVLDHVPTASLDVIKEFSTGYHARNGGGDSIRTDGDLPVLDLREQPQEPEPRRVALADRLGDAEEQPEKRMAFEPTPALLQHTVRDPGMQRPMMTMVGSALIMLRALVGFVILLGLVRGWDGLLLAVDSAVELLGFALDASTQVRVFVFVFGGPAALFSSDARGTRVSRMELGTSVCYGPCRRRYHDHLHRLGDGWATDHGRGDDFLACCRCLDPVRPLRPQRRRLRSSWGKPPALKLHVESNLVNIDGCRFKSPL